MLSLAKALRTVAPIRKHHPITAPFAYSQCHFNTPASARCLQTQRRSLATPITHTAPASASSIQTTLHFSINDAVGSLDEVLRELRALNISLTRIESRPSRRKGLYNFYVDFQAENEDQVAVVTRHLKNFVKEMHVVGTGASGLVELKGVPWFPRKIADLDAFADRVLSFGEELDADHPGFKDESYRKRRTEITEFAKQYRHGDKLPTVEYTPTEIQTWGVVLRKLKELYKTHACREHTYVFPLLEQNCGFREDNIPQIQHISDFLHDCTGWSLRPVTGLLSPRDFLNALAFRVFHSTQYIRHHSQPLYTPEPDVCHELLGHVPLYADPDFADFSQEIGLASLGASDEEIDKLATIYWFTVEFGLCRQGSDIKAYGAGLLSSFGELEYALSNESKKTPFDPKQAAVTKYPITEYQPLYFVADSFKDMKEQVMDYATTLTDRPFAVRYSALTQSIEVFDSRDKTIRFAHHLRGEMGRLIGALEKLS